MNSELKNMLLKRGADLVGFAGLGSLPPAANGGWPVGLVIAVALNQDIITRLPLGPQLDYTREYHRANDLLDSLGLAAEEWLTNRGYPARAVTRARAPYDQTAFRTPLPHKTVARLAGLGWIGPSALLVTREFGGAQRLTSVLTRAPLTVSARAAENACGRCRKCREACPGRAISGRPFHPGLDREDFFDPKLCRDTLTARGASTPDGRDIYDGATCGLCLALCPYTRRYLRSGQGRRS
ncbi:MAG: epoxyqueuosine reductase [Candidatus Adiutrix sp.]|jgi:epoxyqueuosine reductase QueG|nr:epoxyqueuosine reductase [Candidatus Adiutrix sp.]